MMPCAHLTAHAGRSMARTPPVDGRPLRKVSSLLLAALLCVLSFTCTAETAWGEKDESDVLRQAQTYHIMFRTERDAARARARLAAVRDADLLAAFRQLARNESVDPGSAPAGGDLGIVQEGVMVRSFEKALFNLPPGTVSGFSEEIPPLNAHLLQLSSDSVWWA